MGLLALTAIHLGTVPARPTLEVLSVMTVQLVMLAVNVTDVLQGILDILIAKVSLMFALCSLHPKSLINDTI